MQRDCVTRFLVHIGSPRANTDEKRDNSLYRSEGNRKLYRYCPDNRVRHPSRINEIYCIGLGDLHEEPNNKDSLDLNYKDHQRTNKDDLERKW